MAKTRAVSESKRIGARIQTLRKEMGLTTTELGERVGISQAQVSRLETGKQRFRSQTMLKIAKALGVEPVFLFMDDETAAGIAAEPAGEYGLTTALVRAMRSPVFRKLAEREAKLLADDPKGFKHVAGIVDILSTLSAEKRQALATILGF